MNPQKCQRVLVACRGEIAGRIIRTLGHLGIESVAIYDDADAGAPYLETASYSVHLSGISTAETYLNGEAMIAAAQSVGADSVHPGYGFLSENAGFCRQVKAAGLTWIGPSAEVMEQMAHKGEAKGVMMAAQVPIIPGYEGEDSSEQNLINQASSIGYPLLIKASAGGGGRGIRIVHSPDEFSSALSSARREAQKAFGDDHLILEKYLTEARHIEVQIIGDGRGHVISVGERDCSMQRRRQKIIEECPAPGLSIETRSRLAEIAVRAGKALNYASAGTIEFLVDKQENIYFMEMNTRIQVEHPATEMVFGIDIVEQQIRVARDQELPPQDQVDAAAQGAAIEVRLYCEDAYNGFLPQTGQLQQLRFPPEQAYLRIETAAVKGQHIRSDVDPMMAKIIAWGSDRSQALARLQQALKSCQILGVGHNVGYLRELLVQPAFVEGRAHTGTVDHLNLAPPEPKPIDWAAAATFLLSYGQDAVRLPREFHGLSTAIPRQFPFSLEWAGEKRTGTIQRAGNTLLIDLHQPDCPKLTLEVVEQSPNSLKLRVAGQQSSFALCRDGQSIWLQTPRHLFLFHDRLYAAAETATDSQSGLLTAPMDGNITAVRVRESGQAESGETLVILEAMKMEHEIKAPYAGTIAAIHVKTGQQVKINQPMVEMSPQQ